MGLAVFKTVAGQPALSRVGSTPTRSRHSLYATRNALDLSDAHDAWGQLTAREKHQALSTVKGDHFPTIWREGRR